MIIYRVERAENGQTCSYQFWEYFLVYYTTPIRYWADIPPNIWGYIRRDTPCTPDIPLAPSFKGLTISDFYINNNYELYLMWNFKVCSVFSVLFAHLCRAVRISWSSVCDTFGAETKITQYLVSVCVTSVFNLSRGVVHRDHTLNCKPITVQPGAWCWHITPSFKSVSYRPHAATRLE